jgi:hypothetical protein
MMLGQLLLTRLLLRLVMPAWLTFLRANVLSHYSISLFRFPAKASIILINERHSFSGPPHLRGHRERTSC